MVLVEPDDKRKDTANSHEGQEFNYVVEGRLELRIGGNKIILETGDSIMFNAKIPHGMRALDDKPVRFIAIIS
jgi:quercetin dioxygenase-like cupin family protein